MVLLCYETHNRIMPGLHSCYVPHNSHNVYKDSSCGFSWIMSYKIHVNEHGISVHLGPNTVLLDYENIRNGNDITHESAAGVTLVDPDTRNKLFLPRRLYEEYGLCVDVMKSMHLRSDNSAWKPEFERENEHSFRGP